MALVMFLLMRKSFFNDFESWLRPQWLVNCFTAYDLIILFSIKHWDVKLSVKAVDSKDSKMSIKVIADLKLFCKAGVSMFWPM